MVKVVCGKVPAGFLEFFNLQDRISEQSPEQRKRAVEESLGIPKHMDSKKFEKQNRQVWNKLADFMGYGIIEIPEKNLVIYSKRILEEIELEKFKLNGQDTTIGPLEADLFFLGWKPNFNHKQAEMCEKKLLEKGGYRRGEFSSLPNGATKSRYFESSNGWEDVVGKGETKIKSICNACINFYNENFDDDSKT